MGPPSSATWAAEVRRAGEYIGLADGCAVQSRGRPVEAAPEPAVCGNSARRLVPDSLSPTAAGGRPSQRSPAEPRLGRARRRAPRPRSPARYRSGAARDAPGSICSSASKPCGGTGGSTGLGAAFTVRFGRAVAAPFGRALAADSAGVVVSRVWRGSFAPGLALVFAVGPAEAAAVRRAAALRALGRWGRVLGRLPENARSVSLGPVGCSRREDSCGRIIAHKDTRRRSVSIGSTFGCKVGRASAAAGRAQVLGASGRVASGATGRAARETSRSAVNGNGNRCQ